MPLRRVPLVTISLVLANTLIYFLVVSGHLNSAVNTYGVRPCDLNGCWSELPWSMELITSLFVHVSLSHLVFNMLFLLVFGVNVEDRLGHLRFFALYFLCGLLGTLAQLLVTIHDSSLSELRVVGASSAIAGVIGAYFLLFPGSKILLWAYVFVFRIRAAYFLAYWLTAQAIYSGLLVFAGEHASTAFIAHLSGALLGIVFCAHLVSGGEAQEDLRARAAGIEARIRHQGSDESPPAPKLTDEPPPLSQ